MAEIAVFSLQPALFPETYPFQIASYRMYEVSSGLVAYRVALAVAAGQHFTVSGAVLQFLLASVGGLTVGFLVGKTVIAILEPWSCKGSRFHGL